MLQPRWLQALYSLGFEFWLPLPLLGLLFWIGGGLLTDQMLSRSYNPATQLQVDQQLGGQAAKNVRSINIGIDQRRGISRVVVRTANSALKGLEFEFPVTEVSQVEAAIAQALDLSPTQVRKLAQYQIVEGN